MTEKSASGRRAFPSPMHDQEGKMARRLGTDNDTDELTDAQEELRYSNARLNLLAHTAGELLASESPQGVVDSICHRVMEFLDCQAFFNFLVVDQETMRLNACAGIDAEEARRIEWLPFGIAVCGCAARDACRIVAEDIPNRNDPRTELVKGYGITAYACHPLMAKGKVLGTLSFGTSTRPSFTDQELALMKTVADQVSIAMERKEMEDALRLAHDELEQRVRERTEQLARTVLTLQGEIAEKELAEASLQRLNRLYGVLSAIDLALVRAADRQSIFRDFCRIAVEQGEFLLAWVGVVDWESEEVAPVAACGATEHLEELRTTGGEGTGGEGPTGVSIRNGAYYICNDFQNDPCTHRWHEKGRRSGIRASASIAIREEGEVIGALSLYAREKEFFDERQIALLLQMGADISFALDNLLREARRRSAEQALREETLERLRAVEELREKERLLIQQSRQAALGEMIGNIAHQWRQPLNSLGLLVQEIALGQECGVFSDDALKATVADAMGVINHMSQTIDDFRTFFQSDKEQVDFLVREVVEKVASMTGGSFKQNGIRLEVSADGEEALIHGYPNEYSQALLNILLNAKDVLCERRVAHPLVEVRIDRQGGKSLVTVTDNGGGIAVEIMEKIFDPYFTTKSPDRGTGLGLHMSKAIIEKNMNGRLTVRNIPGGAQFAIEV